MNSLSHIFLFQLADTKIINKNAEVMHKVRSNKYRYHMIVFCYGSEMEPCATGDFNACSHDENGRHISSCTHLHVPVCEIFVQSSITGICLILGIKMCLFFTFSGGVQWHFFNNSSNFGTFYLKFSKFSISTIPITANDLSKTQMQQRNLCQKLMK